MIYLIPATPDIPRKMTPEIAAELEKKRLDWDDAPEGTTTDEKYLMKNFRMVEAVRGWYCATLLEDGIVRDMVIGPMEQAQ